ncbi:MAG: hypothetical protein ACR2H3_08165 [Acidimicrobiales bacterium]
MLIACWSAKGGSGTTTVATALALLLAKRSPGGALLVDLAGDIPMVLGRPRPVGPGVAEWSTSPGVTSAALQRLVEQGEANIGVLTRGEGPIDGERAAEGLAFLAGADHPVVVDCGVIDDAGSVAIPVAAAANLSLLVTRACYLGLRRAVAAPIRPSAVVLVEEKHRTLGPAEVSSTLGVPIRAIVPIDSGVARAVDTGLLSVRMPRSLAHALRDAA